MRHTRLEAQLHHYNQRKYESYEEAVEAGETIAFAILFEVVICALSCLTNLFVTFILGFINYVMNYTNVDVSFKLHFY